MVTTRREFQSLCDREREQLLVSLKQAEARIEAGQALDYDPKTFKERLITIYRDAKR